jgi:uracil-DNA glycosylase family 4
MAPALLSSPLPDPGRDCPLCPRLVTFRNDLRIAEPDWHNAPVPSFGAPDARLLIVGLAPGMHGANRTGRPFTGDWAGDLLYATLLKYGLATGEYKEDPNDGLTLINCRITNAVRCLPPENKPIGGEVNACGTFLAQEIAAMPKLKAVLALGTVAHGAVLVAVGEKRGSRKFVHGAQHALADGRILADSYHCSRYNTNTGRLTETMFHAVFEAILARLV